MTPKMKVGVLTLADETAADYERPAAGVTAIESEPELRGRRTSCSPMPVSDDSGVVDAVMRV